MVELSCICLYWPRSWLQTRQSCVFIQILVSPSSTANLQSNNWMQLNAIQFNLRHMDMSLFFGIGGDLFNYSWGVCRRCHRGDKKITWSSKQKETHTLYDGCLVKHFESSIQIKTITCCYTDSLSDSMDDAIISMLTVQCSWSAQMSNAAFWRPFHTHTHSVRHLREQHVQ